MINSKSLRLSILSNLIIPLILIITVETILSYFVTLHYVNKTYDRWLLDTARALAQEIKLGDGKVLVELPPAALEIVKWDDQDKTHFKIESSNLGFLTGDNQIPEPSGQLDVTNPVFSHSVIRNEPVRIVSMALKKETSQDTFFVHVAETLNKRREMMLDILLADLLPQIALVTIISVYLLAVLKRVLKPLYVLADEIAKRSPRDLSPIEEAHVFEEVKTLTDTINDLLHRLAQAIAAQQRFIANAAHQLRTPLAGFVIQAERAAREQDIAMIRPALYQMQTSANRLSHTVNQLLVLAKSEPVDGTYEFKTFDLSDLVRTTCMDWAPKALQRHMELSFDNADRDLFILGDENLLRELLANLLDNAISYGRDAGNISVRLTASPHPVLIMEDDGPGIPPSEKEKIFERFYRIQGSTGNGCGLGLAIVKEIAELHQIRLELNNCNAESGTRIVLTFPVQTNA
ncbi:two-component system, OmpR family, sensor histidine kinase TctE [biofilm metagenome]